MLQTAEGATIGNPTLGNERPQLNILDIPFPHDGKHNRGKEALEVRAGIETFWKSACRWIAHRIQNLDLQDPLGQLDLTQEEYLLTLRDLAGYYGSQRRYARRVRGALGVGTHVEKTNIWRFDQTELLQMLIGLAAYRAYASMKYTRKPTDTMSQ